MAAPYQIAVVDDLAATSTTENIILGRPGQTLNEDSRVQVYCTRESVDVTAGFSLGLQIIMPNGSPANISTVAGSLPSVQDDLWATGFGFAGDDIIIQGVNVNAALQELRVLLKIVAVDDLAGGLTL